MHSAAAASCPTHSLRCTDAGPTAAATSGPWHSADVPPQPLGHRQLLGKWHGCTVADSSLNRGGFPPLWRCRNTLPLDAPECN